MWKEFKKFCRRQQPKQNVPDTIVIDQNEKASYPWMSKIRNRSRFDFDTNVILICWYSESMMIVRSLKFIKSLTESILELEIDLTERTISYFFQRIYNVRLYLKKIINKKYTSFLI
jgi:hypothetical protein